MGISNRPTIGAQGAMIVHRYRNIILKALFYTLICSIVYIQLGRYLDYFPEKYDDDRIC